MSLLSDSSSQQHIIPVHIFEGEAGRGIIGKCVGGSKLRHDGSTASCVGVVAVCVGWHLGGSIANLNIYG